jgi:CBS domain-containing protein
MKISDIMTRKPVTVYYEDAIKNAKMKMAEYGIKHLPVVDRELHVVGILTDRDIKLKQALSDDPSYHENARVSDACIDNPFTVPPDMDVVEVLQQMLKKKIGSTLIAENRELLGIFTSVDAVKVLSILLGAKHT